LLSNKDKVERVTFWGIYDKTSWLNNWPVRSRTSYPLLFDREYKPKPAFFAVVKTAEKLFTAEHPSTSSGQAAKTAETK
jgi:endo-1,4-beta-xylanase